MPMTDVSSLVEFSSSRVEKHQRHVECGPEVDDPFDLRGLLGLADCWFLAKRPTSNSTATRAGPNNDRVAWLPYTRWHTPTSLQWRRLAVKLSDAAVYRRDD